MILLCIAMVITCIFIFGIFLLKENGFWPLKVTIDAFKDIIHSIEITSEQISTFQTLRIVFLIVCITTLILSAIAKHQPKGTKVPLRGMSVATFVLSILGILAAFSLLVISSNIA